MSELADRDPNAPAETESSTPTTITPPGSELYTPASSICGLTESSSDEPRTPTPEPSTLRPTTPLPTSSKPQPPPEPHTTSSKPLTSPPPPSLLPAEHRIQQLEARIRHLHTDRAALRSANEQLEQEVRELRHRTEELEFEVNGPPPAASLILSDSEALKELEGEIRALRVGEGADTSTLPQPHSQLQLQPLSQLQSEGSLAGLVMLLQEENRELRERVGRVDVEEVERLKKENEKLREQLVEALKKAATAYELHLELERERAKNAATVHTKVEAPEIPTTTTTTHLPSPPLPPTKLPTIPPTKDVKFGRNTEISGPPGIRKRPTRQRDAFRKYVGEGPVPFDRVPLPAAAVEEGEAKTVGTDNGCTCSADKAAESGKGAPPALSSSAGNAEVTPSTSTPGGCGQAAGTGSDQTTTSGSNTSTNTLSPTFTHPTPLFPANPRLPQQVMWHWVSPASATFQPIAYLEGHIPTHAIGHCLQFAEPHCYRSFEELRMLDYERGWRFPVATAPPPAYQPYVEKLSEMRWEKFENIGFMAFYRHRSMEEVRLENYKEGLRF